MKELELGHELPLDQESLCGVMGSMKLESSIDETLADLPQVLREHDANSDIKKLPFVQRKLTKKRDTYNLSSLLSTPIKCTLTLGESLKFKPQMWQDLSKTLINLEF